MKTSNLIISLLVISPVTLSAQEQKIEGIVCDDNGNVVEFANVVQVDSCMHFVTGTTTSPKGTFSLPIQRKKNPGYLITSYVGMSSDTISLAKTFQQPLHIILKNKSTEIGEVVVKGKRSLFKNENDIITANVQNTILAKAGSLDNLMNQIPFVSGGGGEYNIFGRGGAVVYLNNSKVYDANILKTINSDRIKKVQVITNPGSRYSSDVKAVIKIFTVDNPDGLGGNAYTSITKGRKFSNNEGASVVYNSGKWQLTGGIGHANYKTQEYTEDRTSVISEPNLLYTNNTTLDYDMTFLDGNLGITYQPSTRQTIGFNTRITKYEHNHTIDDAIINHYTDGVNDFHTDGVNKSKNVPIQWLTNTFYTLSLGKTRLDFTDDILVGTQSRKLFYGEQNDVEVSTKNKSHYLMNSFVADINTPITTKVSLNYGGEFTYSRYKQTFDFDENNIETEMKNAENKNEQILGAAYANLNTQIGKFSMNAGLRYEYASWQYFVGNMKQKSQSRDYNDLFPSLNISYHPNDVSNISLGYRQTVRRPNYGELNDNIEYQSRYYYVQGNSMLDYSYTNSINMLASYKNLRLIGSLDFVNDDIAMKRSLLGESKDIVLSQATNISNYKRWNVGVNWWQHFGIYTPYLEIGLGGQTFSYTYMDSPYHFNHPYVNFKVHNTFELKNDFSITLFVDYYGKNYSLFREVTEQWNTQLSLSKNIKSWFFELSVNNVLCPRSRTSTTRCDWINDASYSNRDNRNVFLLVSYSFNYKQKRHQANTKSNEIRRF